MNKFVKFVTDPFVVITVVCVAVVGGCSGMVYHDEKTAKQTHERRVSDPKTVVAGRVIAEGPLAGCTAITETVYMKEYNGNRQGKELWVVRCPSGETSTTRAPEGKNDVPPIVNVPAPQAVKPVKAAPKAKNVRSSRN